MSDREKREAFVTLATNDTYSLGCLVLGCSLRRVNTSRQLVVMVTTDVSNPMRSQLAQVFDHIQEVDLLDSKDPKNLSLLGRPDLNVTFTKLHCWRLTQFDKAVFLDADTLVLQNVDELFDREELSAAPDAGWPDCFNSGVFVFRPSEETYESLLNFAMSKGSFDGGDQGLLNLYFSNWSTDDISKHLPFIYNVVSQAFYSYLPAFTQFKDRVRIVHFIGAVKPWHQPYNTSSGTVTPLPGSGHSQEFLQVWWNIFMSMVQPTLDPSLRVELERAGLAGDLAHMSVGHYSPTRMLSDKERKLNWEKGQIDYLGQDSFDNIQKKLDETLNKDEAATPPPSISSPFSPKESPKEAPKEVVLEPVKTVAIPQSKEVVAAPPKTVAVITPKVQATAAPKVESAPAPKPAAAPTVKTTTAAAPKVATTAAPKATPAPAPAAAPKVASTAAPKATPAPAPAAAPKVATTAAPKATPAPTPAQAPKVSAPAPKVAAPATKAAPAPAKTVAPAPAKTAAPVAPAKTVAPAAPAKTAAAPAPAKTAAPAPKVTSTAAPPKPGAAGDPKATAAAPKPATAAPGFKAFGAKK